MLFLTGCATTVPVHMSFPQVPEDLMQPCPDLKKVDTKTDKLSDVLSTVTQNYGQYHDCKAKSDAWAQWFRTQKKIFEDIK